MSSFLWPKHKVSAVHVCQLSYSRLCFVKFIFLSVQVLLLARGVGFVCLVTL